jgi:hypothetical protein
MQEQVNARTLEAQQSPKSAYRQLYVERATGRID